MKYPCLVPKRLCKTPVHVHLESEELSNLGEPLYMYDDDLMCNFQDRAKTILTAEKKLVQITGTALFSGDIAPDVPSLSGGTLTVFGQERRIEQGCKNRNPDGTVNFAAWRWSDAGKLNSKTEYAADQAADTGSGDGFGIDWRSFTHRSYPGSGIPI